MKTFQAFALCWCWCSFVAGQCFRDADPDPSPQRLLSGLESFFQASDRFGLRLLRALDEAEDGGLGKNLFLGSFSVWSSLVLLFLGSGGTTERELQRILGLQGSDKNLVAHSYASLRLWFGGRILLSTDGSTPSSGFSMANHVFVQRGAEVRPCLLPFLGESLSRADFERGPELSRLTINRVVGRDTGGRVREMLPPLSVHPSTRLVVTSTMHLKGMWLQPFLPQATQPRPFHVSGREVAFPDTMVVQDTFPHASSQELQCDALELPYVGRSLSMVVLLPWNGIRALSHSLTGSGLRNLEEELFPREVILALPRFRLRGGHRVGPALSRMGLRASLNLTGLFSSFTQPHHLDAVYHEAFVSVDERGTEAGAGASILASSKSARPSLPLSFSVDRPFLFYIRESHSGTLLFMGVVRNPLLH